MNQTSTLQFRASEDFYRLVIESLDDYAIFTTDIKGIVNSWNSGAQRILGYSTDEIMGRDSALFFTQEDIDTGIPEQELKLALNGRFSDERWHVRKDGSQFWGVGLVVSLKDEAGKIQGFTKIMRDVTERRQNLEDLKYQSHITQLITDNASHCLIFIDKHGYPTYLNPAATQATGYTLEDIRRKHLHQVIHHHRPNGRDYPLNECPIDHAMISMTGIKNGEEVFIRRSGSFFPVSFSVTPIEKKGQLNGALVEFEDITARKKAQQTLQLRVAQQETEAQLGLIALSGMDLHDLMKIAVTQVAKVLQVEFTKILELEPDGNFFVIRAGYGWDEDIVFNETRIEATSETQAGYTLKANGPVIIKNLQKVKHPQGHPILRNHGIKSSMTVLIPGKTNTYGVLGAHTTTIRNFTKDDTNFMQAIANVLALAIERKKLEEHKDEFLGIVSHELKTPITSLKAYAQVLQRRFDKEGHKTAVEHLAKMDDQINKLTALIGDLLDITKIEAGRLRFNEDYFDADDLISEIIYQTQLTTNKHKIIRHGYAKRKIFGDRERVGQVLINLLSNAIKYSPYANQIKVFTEIEDPFIKICVQDFGVGISAEKQPLIFERFYRETGPAQITYPGLGLGLYISKEIVQRQGGKVWVESKKGNGSSFCFTLPLDK